MSFGLPLRKDEQRLTYSGYLKLRELTSLQVPLSDPPQHDEMLFIIIHQIYELWFKQLLHEIDAVIERLACDDVVGAHLLLRRCVEIEHVLVNQVAVLETMSPADFLAFRDRLMPASGFQSAQFREIEYASGLKDLSFLANYEMGSQERQQLEARLKQVSLADAFYALLRRRGFNLPAGPDEDSRQARMREMLRIYEKADQYHDLFLLAESLIEYDETFALWRLRHIQMVERMIGSKTGTGGSEGAAYLKKTIGRKFFPELWEMRTHMSKKASEYETSHQLFQR
jgi:tryptophan 2,3-dioxygenase